MTYIYGLAMIIPRKSVRNDGITGLRFLHGWLKGWMASIFGKKQELTL